MEPFEPPPNPPLNNMYAWCSIINHQDGKKAGVYCMCQNVCNYDQCSNGMSL